MEGAWVFPELNLEEGPGQDATQKAEEDFVQAKDLYKNGDFEEAIELLIDVAEVMCDHVSSLLPPRPCGFSPPPWTLI